MRTPTPSPDRPPFELHTRDENVDRLASEQFDVCVIGGGITGAGVALDCASRGLSVALVDKGDFASGTSSRSSGLVHGGLKYLGNGDVRLCRACIRERARLRRLAPHLVQPTTFLYALMGQRRRSTVAFGLTVQDALGGAASLGVHHRVRNGDVTDLAPCLRVDRLEGAWTYVDARTDDARLVLSVIATAGAFGSVAANHVRVEGFERTNGHLRVVNATDLVGGRSLSMRTRAVVNAAGVWSDDVARLVGVERPHLRPTRGVHLVLPAERLPVAAACVFPAVDGREVFVVPDGRVAFVGTTDTDHAGPLDAPVIEPDDADYLLASVRAAFDVDLRQRDVVGGWVGLRPLADDRAEDVSQRSRAARVAATSPDVVTVTGGKLTVYRAMAEDAGDAVCEALGESRRSSTRSIRIDPWAWFGSSSRTRRDAAAIASHDRWPGRPLGLCGSREIGLLRLIAEDPSLGRPLVPGLEALAAEAVWAVRHEMAITLDDVLTRRLRLASRDREAGVTSGAAALVATERAWSREHRRREVRRYARSVAGERGPLTSPGHAGDGSGPSSTASDPSSIAH